MKLKVTWVTAFCIFFALLWLVQSFRNMCFFRRNRELFYDWFTKILVPYTHTPIFMRWQAVFVFLIVGRVKYPRLTSNPNCFMTQQYLSFATPCRREYAAESSKISRVTNLGCLSSLYARFYLSCRQFQHLTRVSTSLWLRAWPNFWLCTDCFLYYSSSIYGHVSNQAQFALISVCTILHTVTNSAASSF